ncbi:ABC transporter ATP-binding protein [Micromonospora sp. NPDC049679]|uniref:ABC transporter ATP-binding protein n=1 Tax=Micromonospora sp. NPDC049679 TaxID=3155920 RepID=UPI0033D2ECD7
MTAAGRVELRRVTKIFPSTEAPAVDAVDLDIAPGEFMTLLGPSGSGKSTTLNMIAGFERLTSGEILVGGSDVAALPAYKRNLGMVFQQYALFPHMTVAGNVAFPLQRRKVDKREIARRVHEVLEMVGLVDLAERMPRQLSGGQQQRVALARAVVFNPPVLLMDEPLGALDKKLREQLQGEIARMHRELGLTFIFVTHDQEEALALSDRIAVFNNGRIEQVGTASELYETPVSLFVADFLGDSNIFRGVVRERAGGRVLIGDGYELTVAGSGDVANGVPGALVVRPERVRVALPDSSAGSGVNALAATVQDVVYRGSHRKVLLRCDVGVTASSLEQMGAESPVTIGDRVLVTWDVDAGAVVPVARPAAGGEPVEQPEPSRSGEPAVAG